MVSPLRQYALGELVEAIQLSGKLGHPHRTQFSGQFYELITDLEQSDSWNPVMQILMDTADLVVKDCGKIELGKPEQAVVMMVELTEVSEKDRKIYLEVHPKQGQIYLPDNLKLMLLNEAGETLMDVEAGSDNKTIPLDFEGEIGDLFSVKLVLGDVIITENFII